LVIPFQITQKIEKPGGFLSFIFKAIQTSDKVRAPRGSKFNCLFCSFCSSWCTFCPL
jgi:hypothetical protein